MINNDSTKSWAAQEMVPLKVNSEDDDWKWELNTAAWVSKISTLPNGDWTAFPEAIKNHKMYNHTKQLRWWGWDIKDVSVIKIVIRLYQEMAAVHSIKSYVNAYPVSVESTIRVDCTCNWDRPMVNGVVFDSDMQHTSYVRTIISDDIQPAIHPTTCREYFIPAFFFSKTSKR